MTEGSFDLYYWPNIPGRGEFVRLALEEAGASYRDVARLPESEGGGVPALLAVLRGERGRPLPFAPPVLVVDGRLVAQVANILQVLAPRLGLAPESEPLRTEALQHQLTIADFVAEVHDTHHPIGSGAYYEEQKAEAKRRAEQFLSSRLPKFMHYFERLLDENGGRYMVGSSLTAVDLSMFQVVRGLEYAFPNAWKHFAASVPKLVQLADDVSRRPNVAAYLASPRRLAFNEDGIFRRYPELDEA